MQAQNSQNIVNVIKLLNDAEIAGEQCIKFLISYYIMWQLSEGFNIVKFSNMGNVRRALVKPILYEIVPPGRHKICTVIRNSLQKYEIKKQLLQEQKHSMMEQKWATLFKKVILQETLTQKPSCNSKVAVTETSISVETEYTVIQYNTMDISVKPQRCPVHEILLVPRRRKLYFVLHESERGASQGGFD